MDDDNYYDGGNDNEDTIAYHAFISSLLSAKPDSNFEYTLTLFDPKSTSFEEAPVTFNLNANQIGDRTIAELILNYQYHHVPYNFIARSNRYERFLKDMDVNKQAYENSIKIDIDLYDHGIMIYRTRNGLSFSKYLKDKK